MNNERFYRYQYLTGQMSLADYKESVELERSMSYFDYALAQTPTLSFDYEAIERRIMDNFKPGDRVRLKGSPYEGKVEQMLQGWDYVRFVTDNYTQITVSDPALIGHVIDPKPGDIYEDKNGNEWVILKQRGWSHHSEDMICARLISYTEVPGYQHSTLALTKPENVTKWADDYGPRLVRRA